MLVMTVLLGACGSASSLEIRVDDFSVVGERGVAHVSVFATELGGATGEGLVALDRPGDTQALSLVDGRARFEVTCSVADGRCREPVELEARWKGLVARYDGRLSRSSAPAGPGLESRSPIRTDAGAPSPNQPESTVDAGSASSQSPASEPPPLGGRAVEVAFMITFRPAAPVTGAVEEVCMYDEDAWNLRDGWKACCQMDATGLCTIRNVTPGDFMTVFKVAYPVMNDTVAPQRGFCFSLTVPSHPDLTLFPVGLEARW